MSSINNWAALNGGGGGGGGGGGKSGGNNGAILLLVLFAGVCCCMLVCGLGLWYAHSQGWLDDLFKKSEDTQAPAPPTEEETPGEEQTDEPDQPAEGTDGGVLNLTDKGYVCSQPWVRSYLKYDKDGTNPKCCTAADAGYQWSNCQAGDVLEVPSKEFPAITVHANVNRIGKDRILGGKLNRGQCPYNVMREQAIWYKETNSKGNVQQVWCHPLKSKGQFAIGEAYAFYPACYKDSIREVAADASAKADKNAEKCSSGTLQWRERTNKVFGGVNNRFKYVRA